MMEYLQELVYRAMSKNPELDEEYARGFAEHQIKQPIDLTRLDFTNLDLFAAEIGATPDEIDAFVMITKALWNHGRCSRTAKESRAMTAQMMQSEG